MLQLPEGSIVKRQLEKKTWHLKSSLHEHGVIFCNQSGLRVSSMYKCMNLLIFQRIKNIMYIYIYAQHKISWWIIIQRKRLNIDIYRERERFQYPTIAIYIYIYIYTWILPSWIKVKSVISVLSQMTGEVPRVDEMHQFQNLSATWNHQPMPWKHKCTLIFFYNMLKCNKKYMNTLMFTLINLNG